MQEETLRQSIARNLTFYRKLAGHTQAELAEQLNYSDKSVSKWERGEGVPDIYVLQQIAELYHITVNDLISTQEPQPPVKKPRLLILLLSLGLVWLAATVLFFALMLLCPTLPGKWLCFLYAVPVSGIILTVFTCLWWSLWKRCLSVAVIIWGLAVCIHLTVPLPGTFLIYVVAAVVQVIFILWFVLLHRQRKFKAHQGQ
ncbi:MAG: helix-turn-helix transcriptional regulator [Clostridia bacterium]|nr:helix-turn-helix transcriptional regulator [Clostridia bacterium]MBR6808721.1 helix-turn-helix transcriptional regulator [Clostridia bacterium]